MTMHVVQSSIASVAEMGFDTVVIAAGAACTDIAELKDTVPLKKVRGQVCMAAACTPSLLATLHSHHALRRDGCMAC